MGTFNTTKTIGSNLTEFDSVETTFRQHFEGQGFNVSISRNSSGFFASITKGNFFSAILGMKSSLNIEVKRVFNGVFIEAKVGIFGQQVIPSIISMFFLWPVLLTQIAGLVKQSKLDDEAVRVLEDAIHLAESVKK
jgi:hypothetical protein